MNLQYKCIMYCYYVTVSATEVRGWDPGGGGATAGYSIVQEWRGKQVKGGNTETKR